MSNAEAGARSQPFTSEELRAFVKEALSSGSYREIPHSRIERAYRNITNDDILHGLERDDWQLAGDPKFDTERNRWRYEISTLDVEGGPLNLIVSPRTELCRIDIITKW